MPAPTIYDKLVGYWKFDALDANSKVHDFASQRSFGTLTNASLVSGGKFGNGLRPSTAAGSMLADDVYAQRTGDRISVNVWINLDKALNTMWGSPVFLDKTGADTRGYFLGVLPGGGNVISFRVFNGAGTPYTASYTESATSGWVMVTGVYEGSVVRIYRNAVSQNTAASDGSLRFTTAAAEVGKGFEGIIDELSVWTRTLSSGDVTTLYAGGTGLQLLFPESRELVNYPDQGSYVDPLYQNLGALISTVPSSLAPELIPQLVAGGGPFSFIIPMLSMLTAPYGILDNPQRVYSDPNPVINLLEVNALHVAHGIAEAGPTDAFQTYNYWEIELEEDVSIVIVNQEVSTDFFESRTTEEDFWNVPPGSNWQGKRARFVIQAVQDSAQIWYSDWVTLTDSNWNNNECPYPPPATYADPVPQIVSVSVTNDRLVTAVGAAGPIASEDMMYRWEVELPDGEVYAIGDETIANVFEIRENVTSQFYVPDGQLWNGMRFRFTVRNEDSAKRHVPQSWSSSWMILNDLNYNNPAIPTPPEPPVWPYAINPAPDLPQIPPISVDLYDVSKYTLLETTDLWPLASGLDTTVAVATDQATAQLLVANAKAGLYRIQYVSGSRRDEATLKYNSFFPGAWKTLSKGMWIQSGKHTPWYVFQGTSFIIGGYNSAGAAQTAAAGYEFIFFHKGGDLSVIFDYDEETLENYSGTISLRVRDVDASYIPGKWQMISSEAGTPLLSSDSVQYPTISGLARGLTHVRYFLTSGDKKPRWQDLYIRVWPAPGTADAATSGTPKQNTAARPNDVTGSGFSVRERRDMFKQPPGDGNLGSSDNAEGATLE